MRQRLEPAIVDEAEAQALGISLGAADADGAGDAEAQGQPVAQARELHRGDRCRFVPEMPFGTIS